MSDIAKWTKDIDLELGLTEIRDCVDEQWTLRALCGASVGVDPEEAHGAAFELSEVVNGLMVGSQSAKASLAVILGGRGNDYQRCLWYSVAGRDPLGSAVDLDRLVKILGRRREFARAAARCSSGVTLTADPYVTDDVDGPLGRFSSDFTLGRQWLPFEVLR
jgi:hypothetical protein